MLDDITINCLERTAFFNLVSQNIWSTFVLTRFALRAKYFIHFVFKFQTQTGAREILISSANKLRREYFNAIGL